MPEPRQSSFSDFVYQCDLLSQPLSGNLVSYPFSSGPSQYSSQPAHFRHQYPPFIFFSQAQHSDPYIITGMTNVPYSFTLVAVVMLFDLHTLFIVPNIGEASPILRFMSFVQRPSSVITPPK